MNIIEKCCRCGAKGNKHNFYTNAEGIVCGKCNEKQTAEMLSNFANELLEMVRNSLNEEQREELQKRSNEINERKGSE